MTDSLFFGGKEYISAAAASEWLGFTRDYIGRMCKEGTIQGRRVGKQWYASKEVLFTFFLEREYEAAVRAKTLSTTRKKEYGESRSSTGKRKSHKIGAQHFKLAFSRVHAPTGLHAYTPAFEIAHKLLALVVSVVFIVAALSLVGIQAGRFAHTQSWGQNAAAAEGGTTITNTPDWFGQAQF